MHYYLGDDYPDDDDELEPVPCGEATYIEPELIELPTEAAADRAEDRWIAERDMVASQ